MTRHRASIDNRPFESLGTLLSRKKIELPDVRLPELPTRPLTAAEEKRLFREAMADVVPLGGKRPVAPVSRRPQPPEVDREDSEVEAVRHLKCLIETGAGFVIKHTAEYVEGSAGRMPPEIFRRIHGGHFSIQGHVDLHGLNVAGARSHFEKFMQRAVSTGMRAVLVVHGRGRSSPGPPVLKRNVLKWLASGRWKRWVIAFTSARSCDGGTGATVVLLRSKPKSGRHT
jgi:DNA-nicking Smr family endonuclease